MSRDEVLLQEHTEKIDFILRNCMLKKWYPWLQPEEQPSLTTEDEW